MLKQSATFLKNKQILIVDDEPENVSLLSAIISLLQGTPVPVFSGTEALSLLNKQTYDLALIDIQMPEVTGWHLIKAIKANQLHSNLIVIAVTAMDSSRQAELLSAGFDAVHNKPVDLSALTKLIRTHITHREQQ